MTTPNTNALAVREALTHGGPDEAERQLAIIGRTGGDRELALAVQSLDPGEVASIVGEGDFTKPSTAAAFITPAQLIGALARIGANWGSLSDSTSVDIARREVTDLIVSATLTVDEPRRAERLRALANDDLGQDALMLTAIGEVGCPELLLDEDFPAGAEHGTWQELFAEVREADLKAFKSLVTQIVALYPALDLSEGSEDVDAFPKRTRPSDKFVDRVLRRMARLAMRHVSRVKAPVEDEVFNVV